MVSIQKRDTHLSLSHQIDANHFKLKSNIVIDEQQNNYGIERKRKQTHIHLHTHTQVNEKKNVKRIENHLEKNRYTIDFC